ncbi:PREDICTED: uncharacterized protein LOC104611021 [Nelumbo nucifera]|uniref:Uncharacterized protein LOC104611021 n=1 Tax=Nelumbo nucifera TaxID=4432 RepID=A0A1U8B992_NELNU|nr:PREDICTED: uncharacterized protein LOC104611021 [Nelumbo nucifera]
MRKIKTVMMEPSQQYYASLVFSHRLEEAHHKKGGNTFGHSQQYYSNKPRQFSSSSDNKKHPNKGFERPSGKDTSVVCQIYGYVGHTATTCRKYLELLGVKKFSNKNANVASCTTSSAGSSRDSVWYPDSGTTNHLTTDLNNLSIHNPCNGSKEITVGNGMHLPISYIGSSTIHTSGFFDLHNILHVPRITKTLLLVSQFCKDNDVVFIFDASDFLVKDQMTGKTLFKGPIKYGLYKVQSISSSSPAALVGECTSKDVWHLL